MKGSSAWAEERRTSPQRVAGNHLIQRPGVGVLVSHIIIMCAGAVFAFRGDFSVGALVSFNAVFVSVSRSVYDITVILPQLIQAAVGMERIERILGEQTNVKDEPSGAVLAPLARDITFRDVSFEYNQDRLILNKGTLPVVDEEIHSSPSNS
jgi:ABC-type bacteriocin/lantibiotic exporter with double-glycine peptidase domain